jgi:hypothetical protein
MDTARPISSLLLFLAMGVFASADPDGVPSLEAILHHMEEARAENRAHFRPFKVSREYKLFGKEKQKPKSQVIAAVTFVPPNSKKFVIQQTQGSTALGEHIVRQMLDGEAEAAKHYTDTDISAANYDFRFVREENLNGQRCYVIEQIPKRKERTLLHGTIWVDAKTYRLHRFMGEPAKAPSWWLKDSRIEFNYGEVDGMWLQTGSEASANVRFFGPYTMSSRDVEYRIGVTGAANDSFSAERPVPAPRPLVDIRHLAVLPVDKEPPLPDQH